MLLPLFIKNESEALSIVLKNTPFIYKERENYFVIQKAGIDKRLVIIQGTVYDEEHNPWFAPMCYC